MATKTQETAVRAYLQSVLDPNYVSPEIATLEKELADETDVIKIVKLKQAIRNEREGTKLKEGFVANAKAWAESESIGPKTLEEMSVPTEVLKEAGFTVKVSAGAAKTGEVVRRTRVTAEDVERSIRAHKTGTMLSVPDLVDKTGASNATVTKVLKGLVGEAVAEPVDDPNHEGRGRAAKLYERT